MPPKKAPPVKSSASKSAATKTTTAPPGPSAATSRPSTSADASSRATRSSQNAISFMHSRNKSPVSTLSQELRSVRDSVSSAELVDKEAPAGPVFHRCSECVYKFKSRTAWVKCVRCPEPSGWAHSLCAGFKSEAEAKRSDWICGDCRSAAVAPLTAAFASSPLAHVHQCPCHQPQHHIACHQHVMAACLLCQYSCRF